MALNQAAVSAYWVQIAVIEIHSSVREQRKGIENESEFERLGWEIKRTSLTANLSLFNPRPDTPGGPDISELFKEQ